MLGESNGRRQGIKYRTYMGRVQRPHLVTGIEPEHWILLLPPGARVGWWAREHVSIEIHLATDPTESGTGSTGNRTRSHLYRTLHIDIDIDMTGSHPVWAGGIERWCRRGVDSTYPCRNYTNIYDRNSLARVKKDTSDVGYILLSMISYLGYCVCIHI